MKLIAACLGVLFALAAWRAGAGECSWGVVTVGSRHFGIEADRKGRTRDYEEQNWGFGLEHCLGGRLRAIGGGYRNSLRNDSMYAGVAATAFTLGPASLGVAVVAVNGYQSEVVVVPIPMLMLEGGRVGANISVIPKFGTNPGVIGLQMKWRFR